MPVEKIKSFFEEFHDSPERIKAGINGMDHFEIARRFHEFVAEDKIRIFNFLDSDQKRQEVLYETDKDSRLEIQKTLDKDFLAQLLDKMDEDEATDILQEHPEETQEEILSKMEAEEARIIKDLITYKEETAGGLMIPDYNKVHLNQSAAEILRLFKSETNQDKAPYFYIVDDHDKLIGYFILRDLLNVSTSARPMDFRRKETPKVFLQDPCDRVANLMDHERLSAIPVVDEDNVMQGVVTFDDVIRAMQDIASEDIFTMVGTAKVDPFAKRAGRKIAARVPWLFMTFIGGLVSAFLLSVYQDKLSEFVTIIFFVPFVIGLAGNVGIQGSTVIVRGLATGDIQQDNLYRVVRSEILVGIFNGIIFGVLCGLLLAAISGSVLNMAPLIGLTVGIGIVLAVGMAALIGSLTPILFIRLGIDPAISAGPMVTVTNDIVGLAIYLGTTSLLFSVN